MIILFVGHGINHPIKTPIVLALFGGSQILGDVDGGSVASQQNFGIQSPVLQIHPNSSGFISSEQALLQTPFY